MSNNLIEPDYYGGKDSKYQPRHVAREWEVSGNLFNALKYIKRDGKAVQSDNIVAKRIEDLRKAQTYLEFEIEDISIKAGVPYERK